MATEQDLAFMAEALVLAKQGQYSAHPNPCVGAVLVKDGRVIGRGAHLQAGEAHAEVLALKEAGAAARGATAYVTLEPCSHYGRTPPCADALIAAGIARVVIAMRDPNPLVAGRGVERLRAAGVVAEEGCLEAAAEALNPGFLRRMRHGRPWMRLKQAMSLDGRVALANGQSQWLTGEAARADVQQERARASAILVGIGTVLADNPRLAPRLETPLRRYPVKVIVDSHLRTPPDAALFGTPGAVWIFHRQDAPVAARAALCAAGAELLICGSTVQGLDWQEVTGMLAERQINEVLVEAGPGVAASLFAVGLIDEWLLYVAPLLLGQDARPVLATGPYSDLAEVPRWSVIQSSRLGNDIKWTLRPQER
ncbi:bifunctional diaminohydroxyphosphoribosylaminopyrimidine deaminase/5-amino-6-(5-phosphoribosylamino)uracil reductase RibD [Acidithiobacillus sp.]|uniref:bifunctional diaminohydroxyphosphoribosylaminopyrimidine deaminase/5-amino-6-(5-phosphoribosylamino)uracil reductase RibD n=1 Tax=Acidithiobacillus sp. TaxID=1872118 RepID=UPI00258872D1|nr:bifunctional diaminohydroxyphosphoribosylaminopyrimidine deaminase/5-amino-6-(5-phosphoribosylamino)uracil reductase RibD [Acidithiobacillus sp.]MDD5375987.1 bifunctional diaminohydroxyphosphoribosylaminopyrimidine deaminase/5-amino-6-(5-phosphoribosylamino)uracil reductase RibD [Acidithiobacillus sp.]